MDADLELIEIETDTHPLDGLYYRPKGEVRAQAMILHGNCMNFYTGAPRFLPGALAALGIATLAFNRRGHDVLATLNSRQAAGGAFQRIDEALADTRFAEDWLSARGPGGPILIGHSNGGMLAAAHAAGRADIPALVLLSAHQGGTGMARFASGNGLLAGDRVEELLQAARAAVAAGRGDQLLMLEGWWYVASAASLLDTFERLPDTLELAPQIRCPSLFLVGGLEPPENYPAEAFARQTGGPCTVRIIPGCDHFYAGHTDVVTDEVLGWLADTLGLQR